MKKNAKKCKVCGTTENLHKYKSGKKTDYCEEHYGKNIGKCVYCNDGLIKILVVEKLKNKFRTLPCCIIHYDKYKKDVLEKRKQTCLKLYGVENTFQSEKIYKIKQTNLERYGTENPFQSDICKEKIKQTCLEKFGVEYAIQSKEIKEKRKNTNLERYGTEYPFQNEGIKKQIKQTNLEKYGVENTFQYEPFKEKAKQTNLKLYGSEYVSNNKDILEKKKQTSLKHYGVEYPFQCEEVLNKVKRTNLERYGVEYATQNEEINYKAMSSKSNNLKLKKYKDTELTYQTKPELRFIEYCINNNIEIENGDRVPYMFNGKKHYYYCDFKIKEKGQWRLIEIKRRHHWYFEDIKSGKLLAKAKFALIYSVINNYLPYKMLFIDYE